MRDSPADERLGRKVGLEEHEQTERAQRLREQAHAQHVTVKKTHSFAPYQHSAAADTSPLRKGAWKLGFCPRGTRPSRRDRAVWPAATAADEVPGLPRRMAQHESCPPYLLTGREKAFGGETRRAGSAAVPARHYTHARTVPVIDSGQLHAPQASTAGVEEQDGTPDFHVGSTCNMSGEIAKAFWSLPFVVQV